MREEQESPLESFRGEHAETEVQRPDLRLELKVKNSRLWHAIYDRYGSVAGLCRTVTGLQTQQTAVGRLLRFKESPWTRKGELRRVAHELVKALRILAEDLFPPHLYREEWESERALEVHSFSALPNVVRSELRLLPAPDSPVEDFSRDELKEELERALHTLPDHYQKVLRLRFGLGGERTHSLKEVGHVFGTTGSNIQQMEARALRHWRFFLLLYGCFKG